MATDTENRQQDTNRQGQREERQQQPQPPFDFEEQWAPSQYIDAPVEQRLRQVETDIATTRIQLNGTKATLTAVQQGSEATLQATQAGMQSTQAAVHAGTWSTMLALFGGLIGGVIISQFGRNPKTS